MEAYLELACDAIAREDGFTLAALVSLRDEHIYDFVDDLDPLSLTAGQFAAASIGQDMADILCCHVQALYLLESPVDAYEYQLRLVRGVFEITKVPVVC